MSSGEIGQKNEGAQEVFVAVRSEDRRHLLSPSLHTVDFFTTNIAHQPTPLEDRMAEGMRADYGIVIKNDHGLTVHGEPNVRAYATYLRHVLDYSAVKNYGSFTPHQVNEIYHTLRDMSTKVDDFPEIERRQFRVKAALFHQVLNLFSGKSPDGAERHHR